MSTPTFEKNEALKNLDKFFKHDKRIDISLGDSEQLRQTTRYILSQVESRHAELLAAENPPPRLFPFGVIDTAFTDEGTTFIICGDECYAYTDSYETPDEGYPKSIHNLGTPILAHNRINAAFIGPDGTRYFFHNRVYSESHSDIMQSTAGRWGRLSSLFNTQNVIAAFTKDNHTYLIGNSDFVRYTGDEYGSIDGGFPRQNTLFHLLEDMGCNNNQETYKHAIVTAAYINGLDIVLTTNEGQDFLFRDQGVSLSSRNPSTMMSMNHQGITYILGGGARTMIVINPREGLSPIQTFSLPKSIDFAFKGLDGNINLFFENNFISIPGALFSRTSIVNALQDQSNSRPVSEIWGIAHSNIGRTGIVDAALMIVDAELMEDNFLYLFSGEEYVRFTAFHGTFDQYPDQSYPKLIRTNEDGLPQHNRIDAAFVGIDGKRYFFNKEDQTYVTDDDFTTPISTKVDTGNSPDPITKPDGDLIGAAFLFEQFSYLLTDTEFIRYPNGDDGFIDLIKQSYMDRRLAHHIQLQESRIHPRLQQIDDTLLKMAVPDLNLGLLHLAESKTKGKGDGRISEADAKLIIAQATAGEAASIDKQEFKTIAYILARYNVTPGAKAALLKAIQ